MENDNLSAFKYLIDVKNTELLNNVIEDYCSVDSCDYDFIEVMYNDQLRINGEPLTW